MGRHLQTLSFSIYNSTDLKWDMLNWMGAWRLTKLESKWLITNIVLFNCGSLKNIKKSRSTLHPGLKWWSNAIKPASYFPLHQLQPQPSPTRKETYNWIFWNNEWLVPLNLSLQLVFAWEGVWLNRFSHCLQPQSFQHYSNGYHDLQWMNVMACSGLIMSAHYGTALV